MTDKNSQKSPCTESNGMNNGTSGMTLRDYFAGQCIAPLIAKWGAPDNSIEREVVANSAYKIADAMLSERLRSDLGGDL